MWVELIEYGIGTGEFRPVEPEAVYDVIVFPTRGKDVQQTDAG